MKEPVAQRITDVQRNRWRQEKRLNDPWAWQGKSDMDQVTKTKTIEIQFYFMQNLHHVQTRWDAIRFQQQFTTRRDYETMR